MGLITVNLKPIELGTLVARNSHWIGLFGILFGAALSAYFYLASKQVGEISMSFKTVKIAQAGIPILKILDDKGENITADVYGLEAVIWNTGDISLGDSSDRVRKPLTIALSGPVRILGAVVQDTRNVSTADVRAVVHADQKSLSINWRQFDPADAIKVFIIYTGQTQSGIEYSARVVGAHLINISEYKETAPDVVGLSKFYYGTMYDWENHKLKLMLNLIAILLQFVIMGLILAGRKTRSTVWVPVLMAFSVIVTLVSIAPFLIPKGPF
jgi:hypothetical protein